MAHQHLWNKAEGDKEATCIIDGCGAKLDIPTSLRISDIIADLRELADSMEAAIAAGVYKADHVLPIGSNFISWDWKNRIKVQATVAIPANENEAAAYEPREKK